ncbi:MAG TPA: threonine synthase, partial [Thermoplasmata archaeon]|nr:threonine synthase [Thermoplasmata archaeon]
GALFDSRLGRTGPDGSGVWRFRELVHPLATAPVSRGEGNTNLYSHEDVAGFAGIRKLLLKHDGENPTGSFKDRGVAVAVTEALRLGAPGVCAASTGNGSSSLASYAALARLPCEVFVPRGGVSPAKLAQVSAYRALVVEVDGSFDDAMRAAEEHASRTGVFLLNPPSPWRLEGYKSAAFELFQQLRWGEVDWIALPAGNLGNAAGIGKGLDEARRIGLISSVPRLLLVQAEGAAPFYRMWRERRESPEPEKSPKTIASAISVGRPTAWRQARRALLRCGGDVEAVSDSEILEAKRVIDGAGIGCEPAAAASLAGVRKCVADGRIGRDERVVCILTGHLLKDVGANGAGP